MNLKADHFAFEVSDLDASIDFYSRILGLKVLSKMVDSDHHEAFAFLELEGANLELLQRLDENNLPLPFQRPPIQPPFCPHLAIRSENLEGLLAELQKKGVPVVKDLQEIPGQVKWFYVSDPDHNVIEYVQWLKK
ncbi:MAG: VOC family protein [Calditrichaeota bacterium]|nr:VOC family protein [Calditrichota bacterium]